MCYPRTVWCRQENCRPPWAICPKAPDGLNVPMPLGWLRIGLVIICLVNGALLRAACPTCASYDSGVVAGIVSFSALNEASGIAASARNPGVLWTHNDGGA